MHNICDNCAKLQAKKDLQVIDLNCKSLNLFGRYIQTRTGDLYDVKVWKYYLNYILIFNWRKFGVTVKLSIVYFTANLASYS